MPCLVLSLHFYLSQKIVQETRGGGTGKSGLHLGRACAGKASWKGRRRWASEVKGVRRHISREINLCQEGRRAAWEGQDRNDAEEGIRYSGSRFRKSGGLRMNSSESN